MKDMLPMTVVVPAYRRATQTARLVDSLCDSTHNFEIVVVDDASPQPLVDSLAPSPRLRVLRHATRRGPAAARNTGIRAASASSQILAFTDNDCVAHPAWAARIFTYASRLSATYAGVGGRTLPLGDDVFSRYYGYHKTLDPWLEAGRYLYVVTANAAFRRTALERVGGFDEHLARPGGEDPGLCFKLDRAGYRLAHDPEAIVFHHYRPSVLDFVRTFYRYGAGCRHQAERHAALGSQPPQFAQGFGGVVTANAQP